MSSKPTLTRKEDVLVLCDGAMEISVNFAELHHRTTQGHLQKELLIKAAKIKDTTTGVLSAIDATAGLGEDSFLLAAAGFEVTMFEQNATIAALLRNGIERALQDPLLADVAARMHLVEGDSIKGLKTLASAPDIIYLDPMFPSKTKTAATKKKFQLLHSLEKPCSNEEELLSAALAARPQKVIVKRPAKGPHLSNIQPAYSLLGKAIRYDVYTPASMKF